MEDKLLNEEHAAAQTAENYRRVCDEIAEAAYKACRDPSEIRLVGATKFKTCAEILPVLKAKRSLSNLLTGLRLPRK